MNETSNNLNSILTELNELRKIEKEFRDKTNIITTKIKNITDDIEKILSEKVKFLEEKYKIWIYCYLHSFIYEKISITFGPISNDDHCWQFNSKFGWFVSNDPTILNIKKIPLPISDEELNFIIKELSIYDIPVIISETTVKEHAPKNIKSFEDIQLLLGKETKLLLAEEIWYVGWDIEDHICIVEDPNNKIHLFFTTDAHGGDWEQLSPTFKNIEEFKQSEEYKNETGYEDFEDSNFEREIKLINKLKKEKLEKILQRCESNNVLKTSDWLDKILESWKENIKE